LSQTNARFTSFLLENSIVQRIASLYTPDQNGIMKRKHCRIMIFNERYIFKNYILNFFIFICYYKWWSTKNTLQSKNIWLGFQESVELY
jgi:hypothetical protein